LRNTIPKDFDLFSSKMDDCDLENYYLTTSDKDRMKGSPEIRAMINIDGIMRGCLIGNFDFSKLYKMTGNNLSYISYRMVGQRWSSKHKKYVVVWEQTRRRIARDDQKKFSIDWSNYMEDNDIYDYTRMLECVYEYDTPLHVRFLFVDEFQDFSPLQFEIYEQWKASKTVSKVWIAGDDAQAVFRFSGGSPNFMLNTECTENKSFQ
jgi:Superfamily I DNA and RNA helicases